MNELQILWMQRRTEIPQPIAPKIQEIKTDNRYKCLVMLMRADRPRMWAFKCHNCGSKIADLMNQEVFSITDFFDPQNPNNHGIGRHCKGRVADGTACPYSYFFQLQ